MSVGSGEEAAGAHLLSFDVEEYFQVEAAAAHLGPDTWNALPQRLGPAVDRLLELLAEWRTSATFFVLGWVARHEPDVVRRIAQAGHEIASHGMTHQMLGRLGPGAFRGELRESKAVLEDLAGRAVLGYRAPTFSLTQAAAWALDVLAEEGFRYDSSIFPVHHDRYGVPDAPRHPHVAVGPGGGSLLELPPLTLRVLGTNLPVAGGGYLRLFPVRLVHWGLKQMRRQGWEGMLYLHPWELDPEQPVLPMSLVSRWRHRVGLRGSERKLRWLMERHAFGSVAAVLARLLGAARQTHTYGTA